MSKPTIYIYVLYIQCRGFLINFVFVIRGRETIQMTLYYWMCKIQLTVICMPSDLLPFLFNSFYALLLCFSSFFLGGQFAMCLRNPRYCWYRTIRFDAGFIYQEWTWFYRNVFTHQSSDFSSKCVWVCVLLVLCNSEDVVLRLKYEDYV